MGFGKDFDDFFFAKEWWVFEVLLGELGVEVTARSARCFGTTELTPFTGEELARTAPRFLGFGFDEIVGPIDKFTDAGTVGTDTVKSGLMYRVTDFLDLRPLVFELAVSSECIEA